MTIAGISPDAREAPLLLDTEPPRTLGFTDQAAFWGNIGVSLIGFSGAAYVLYPTGHPPLPLLGALLATLLGTLVGTAMVAGTGAVGTRTGAPAMVVLRGLFGTRLSFVPTVANVVQCVGWGVYELTVIALGVAAMTQDRVPHALVIVAAGVLSTVMAIWPLRVVHLLRKYVTVAVGIAMVYFTVALLRSEVPAPTETSWSGFFPAVDTTLAVSVSFVPLAADYARHSRTVRDSAGATILGYPPPRSGATSSAPSPSCRPEATPPRCSTPSSASPPDGPSSRYWCCARRINPSRTSTPQPCPCRICCPGWTGACSPPPSVRW